ncbi:MAG: hypothetical protein M3O97_00620 [Thermoproteota archaeon]|jgi:hypothetical protein|nr:hypothetical protein [Thermoproteota archaeon]HZA99860.1 hypothetical protein [Nitrososphaera sp.]
MKRKRTRAIRILLAKKSTMIIPKAGVLLMVKIREGYYRSRRYEISDRYYFDNGRADL